MYHESELVLPLVTVDEMMLEILTKMDKSLEMPWMLDFYYAHSVVVGDGVHGSKNSIPSKFSSSGNKFSTLRRDTVIPCTVLTAYSIFCTVVY